MNNEIIHVVLPEELKKQIKLLAERKNLSLNAVVRLALSELIERNE